MIIAGDPSEAPANRCVGSIPRPGRRSNRFTATATPPRRRRVSAAETAFARYRATTSSSARCSSNHCQEHRSHRRGAGPAPSPKRVCPKAGSPARSAAPRAIGLPSPPVLREGSWNGAHIDPCIHASTSTPQVNTTYQAQWKGAESSVAVQVQPMIKLPFVSHSGWFHFYVTAGESFAGRSVYLQRFTLSHTWINVRKLQLGQQSGRIMSLKSARSPSRAVAGRSGSTCRRARCRRVTSTRGAARSPSSSADAPRERGLLVRALVPLLNGVPVDDVPPGLEIFGPAVLVLQVVGVLPHVDAEQRDVRVRDR